MRDGYGRALLSLSGIVADTSVLQCKGCKPNLSLPREYNHLWRQLYGTCQVGYVIPKRLFLLLTDQLITDYLITYVYRRPVAPKIRM
jgi:hypothetical protein